MKVFYPLISKFLIALLILLNACSSSRRSSGDGLADIDQEHILHGSISYPFVRTNPMGINGKPKKFIIRSISPSGTEYVLEIPDAGKDYNIEIPMAKLSPSGHISSDVPHDLASAARTDREMTASLPDLAQSAPEKTAFVDKAFGVGKASGPSQSPSYSLRLAKISKLFKQKQYEYCLIEINDLLNYYPQSPRLHKMKGTVYIKMHNHNLAEKSWLRALEYTPNDKILQQSLTKLQNYIKKTFGPTGQEQAKLETQKTEEDNTNPDYNEPQASPEPIQDPASNILE